MSAYDKPVSKLAESPELCTGLESLMVSEQQEHLVIPGLKNVNHNQWGSEKNQKCPEVGKEGGEERREKEGRKGKREVG